MIQLVIIAGYLALLLMLGLYSTRLFRGTSDDYLLASHSIGPFLLLMSLFGTTMTAFALVGSTGEAYKSGVGVYGLLASSSGIIHSLCFFLIGIKVWSFGKRYGYRTQISFFRDRLENDTIGLLLFPILVGLVIPYLLIGVIAAGTVVNAVTEGAFVHAFAAYDYGLPNWLASLVVCATVLVYVFYGGMRGTAWANTFQTIVFMVLGIVTFFIISHKLGGLESASRAVLEKHPSKLMREVSPKEEEAYQQSLRKWQTLAAYNWSVREGRVTWTDQQLREARATLPRPAWPGAEARYALAAGWLEGLSPRQRQLAYLAQDDRVFPSGTKILDSEGRARPLSTFPRIGPSQWHAQARKLYAARIGHPRQPMSADAPDGERKWSLKKTYGVYKATHWAPTSPHPMSPWIFFTYLLVPLSVGMFPHLFQHWLTARSADSFRLPIVMHPLFIMIVWVPCVLVGIWATAATLNGRPVIPPHFPANAVLAKMVKDLTGPILGGLLTAGILAAIMSSLDSQFLCLGTIFTTDIVMHYGGKERFSDRQQILLARGFIVAVVALTYLFSLAEPRRVFPMGVWCFSGFSSLFPLVFAALYWRRLTASGAIASVLAAMGSWGWLFYQSGFAKNADYHVAGLMPVTVMVAASTLALVVVSLLTRPPSKKTLAKFFSD